MKPKNNPEITKEYLDSILRYEPDSGILYWRVRRGSNVLAGDVAGGMTTDGYIRVAIKRKLYGAHNLIWIISTGKHPIDILDHEDHDPSNNRIGNLREATDKQNHQNRKLPVSNTSGVIGVNWFNLRGYWHSKITVNGVRIHLGSHDSFLDAVAARKSAQAKYGFHENHGKAVVSNA